MGAIKRLVRSFYSLPVLAALVALGVLLTPAPAAAVAPMCQIGDIVWHDLNRNGLQDPGEPGIDGVTVVLKDSGGTIIATTITAVGPGGQHGYYQFIRVECGQSYTVEASTPPGFSPTTSGVGLDRTVDSNGSPAPVTLPENAYYDETIDFGFVSDCSGTIGNFVWHDLNGNGIQDPGEPGINGVTVVLTYPGGAVIATTTAVGPGGQNGYYQFGGLCPGAYQVQMVPPAGYTLSPTGQGTTETDSNVSPSPVVLTADNPSDQTIDFGLFRSGCTGTIGNFVWYDRGGKNANGIQDPGELGIDGVTMTLWDSEFGAKLATTTTAVGPGGQHGYYQFSGLCGGTYYVERETIWGYYPTFSYQGGNPANDSNSSPFKVILPGDHADDQTIDFGFASDCDGTIGNFVWLDLNADGIQNDGQTGIDGVTLRLHDATDNSVLATTFTANGGYYQFTGLCGVPFVKDKVEMVPPLGYALSPANVGNDRGIDSNENPSLAEINGNNFDDQTFDFGVYRPASIGDFVWEDKDANGQQNAGEPGIPGVQVSLQTCAGLAVNDINGNPVLPQATDANGGYLFANLVPGCYQVLFATPAGFRPSPANVGNDASDSDAAGGVTGNYTLTEGEYNPTVDAGFFKPAAIGDFVWNDLNANGVQDGGLEVGIPNVLVTLQTCGGGPVMDINGNLVAAQPTDANGGYLFANLVPGCYRVMFATPGGYTPSPANVGSDATDSDAVGGLTGNYTLVSGQTDLTVDAGFYMPAPVLAGLGDYVWIDANGNGVQDATELGLNGVTVNLYECAAPSANPPYRTTLTANNPSSPNSSKDGYYSFTGLPAGCYIVEFVKPSGYIYALPFQTGAALDSDANVTTGRSGSVTLAPGDFNPTIDAGLIPGQDYCPPDGSTLPGDGKAGKLYVWQDANYVYARYEQSRYVNDNTYGTSAIGWANGHTFGNLTGSDKAEFIFKDASGATKLDFFSDYIHATTISAQYPSGYKSNGPTASDGSCVSAGCTTYVVDFTSSLAENLNKLGYCANGTCIVGGVDLEQNSPPADANYNLTNPAFTNGWDFTNWYYVKVAKTAFGTAGFGSVDIGIVHNSPAKTGSNADRPGAVRRDGAHMRRD